MRRTLYVVSCLLAMVTMLGAASPAIAQAPAPKVTITGFIDEVGAYNRNQGLDAADRLRGSLVNPGDDAFYGRTRGRFDIVGELGKAKGVLGTEFDLIYGQTGISDSCSGPFQGVGCRPDGTSGGFDADNDVRNTLELKWMYVEFPFTGPGSLLPFVPVQGIARLGGLPYNLGLKSSVLADSDFGGAQLDFRFTPGTRLLLTYAQFEGEPHGLAGQLGRHGFRQG